ncbi:MAG: LCP family protein [Ornithinimicrobium sp.]
MPRRPEDDWTRPMPRTPRGSEPRRSDQGWQVDREWQTDSDWQTDSGARTQQWQGDPQHHEQDEYPYSGAEQYGQEQWQEPVYEEPSYDQPPPPGRRGRTHRPRYGMRRVSLIIMLIIGAYVAAMIWAVASSYFAIGEVDATPDNADRPGSGSGSNVVLVGTDSREDLTQEQRNELKTGSVEGSRADTIMLLHLPTAGDPTLVSLPRDSYVDIPGNGMNKINAAYSIGGPPLLVDSVEQATGLRVDGYLEVGFDGFVDVVAEVGGVEMCLPDAVFEERSDLDLPAGCQELEGKDALNYVRMRYSDPRGDLGRVERQREFLAAMVQKMTRPSTLLVPWELQAVGTATGSSLKRGEDTSMWELVKVGLAMRSISNGSGDSITVPVADANYSTSAGSAVLWDEADAGELFEALRTGEPLTIEP